MESEIKHKFFISFVLHEQKKVFIMKIPMLKKMRLLCRLNENGYRI